MTASFLPARAFIDRAKAPDLARVYRRLRPGCARQWLAKPGSILPYLPSLPDPRGDGLASGPQRIFQNLDVLESLAEFGAPACGSHIPPQGSHSIRYHGWYSNENRGVRCRSAATAAAAQPGTSASPAAEPIPARSRSSQTWAMLIQRVCEIDPLTCPRCSGQMKVVAFLEPPQADVVEKILRSGSLTGS